MEYIALTSWPRRLAGAWPRDAQTKAERMKLSTTIVCGQHYSSTVIVMMISDTWGRFNMRTFLSATGWSRRVFGGGLPLWRWRLKLNLGLAFRSLHCTAIALGGPWPASSDGNVITNLIVIVVTIIVSIVKIIVTTLITVIVSIFLLFFRFFASSSCDRSFICNPATQLKLDF